MAIKKLPFLYILIYNRHHKITSFLFLFHTLPNKLTFYLKTLEIIYYTNKHGYIRINEECRKVKFIYKNTFY